MNNSVQLSGLITKTIVNEIIEQLQELLDKEIANLILEIDSGGGDISCMTLFHFLQSHPQIITKATNNCKSAAVTVLLGGTLRHCIPETQFLLHLGAMKDYNITPELYFDPSWRTKHKEYIEMKQITANRLNMSEQEFIHWVYPERILNATDALKIGLVDTITNN